VLTTCRTASAIGIPTWTNGTSSATTTAQPNGRRTTAWFAIRFGPSTFGIFDVFPDDAGRDAHLSGPVAAALGEQTGTLFSEPTIERLDIQASKLPT
jgi:quinol monooxygenase YgiN